MVARTVMALERKTLSDGKTDYFIRANKGRLYPHSSVRELRRAALRLKRLHNAEASSSGNS